MSTGTERVEVEVGGGVRLVGVLARPVGESDAPAALLLSGSGPLDRDSNMPGQVLDISRALASALAEHGVASLRYDKRDSDDIRRIGGLVSGPFTGETPDGLTHLLRVHAGPPSLGSYRAQLKEPVDAALLERVAAWTKER